MAPKFANPHSLSKNMEIITRSEITGRSGLVAEDSQHHTIQRALDDMLRDIWADALADTSKTKKRKRRKMMAENRANEDDKPVLFRLLSSMDHSLPICLDAKPLPSFISRGPDCEDDEAQAGVRRIRALSAAVDSGSLILEAAVSKGQVDPKPIIVQTKVLDNASLAVQLPPLLVTEESRTNKAVRRVATRNLQSNSAASPHEPRPSCVVLPVVSREEVACEKRRRRKFVRERPSPAYWRPSSGTQGKCIGYALGYPSNWAPEQAYVRDVMKSGVESTFRH